MVILGPCWSAGLLSNLDLASPLAHVTFVPRPVMVLYSSCLSPFLPRFSMGLACPHANDPPCFWWLQWFKSFWGSGNFAADLSFFSWLVLWWGSDVNLIHLTTDRCIWAHFRRVLLHLLYVSTTAAMPVHQLQSNHHQLPHPFPSTCLRWFHHTRLSTPASSTAPTPAHHSSISSNSRSVLTAQPTCYPLHLRPSRTQKSHKQSVHESSQTPWGSCKEHGWKSIGRKPTTSTYQTCRPLRHPLQPPQPPQILQAHNRPNASSYQFSLTSRILYPEAGKM